MSILKEKALAAIAEVEEWKAAGENWPQWNRRYLEFRQEAKPEDILELLAENEALKQDAERYRWIRGEDSCQDFVCLSTRGKDMDAAIDAAIADEA